MLFPNLPTRKLACPEPRRANRRTFQPARTLLHSPYTPFVYKNKAHPLSPQPLPHCTQKHRDATHSVPPARHSSLATRHFPQTPLLFCTTAKAILFLFNPLRILCVFTRDATHSVPPARHSSLATRHFPQTPLLFCTTAKAILFLFNPLRTLCVFTRDATHSVPPDRHSSLATRHFPPLHRRAAQACAR